MFLQSFRLLICLAFVLLGRCFQNNVFRSVVNARIRPETQFRNCAIRTSTAKHSSLKSSDFITVVKDSPSACQFIVANREAFRSNLPMRKLYGITADPAHAQQFHAELPIIYLAGQHKEYGTIGYQLNKRLEGITMNVIHPELRYLRSQPVYAGGPEGSGSSFTMLHRKAGFPDNRPWKTMPGKPDFKLFYSPDVAMANELCSTNNAFPSEFRFFRWSCVWSPGQLEEEHRKGLWTTFDSPIEMVFPEDEGSQQALFQGIRTLITS